MFEVFILGGRKYTLFEHNENRENIAYHCVTSSV